MAGDVTAVASGFGEGDGWRGRGRMQRPRLRCSQGIGAVDEKSRRGKRMASPVRRMTTDLRKKKNSQMKQSRRRHGRRGFGRQRRGGGAGDHLRTRFSVSQGKGREAEKHGSDGGNGGREDEVAVFSSPSSSSSLLPLLPFLLFSALLLPHVRCHGGCWLEVVTEIKMGGEREAVEMGAVVSDDVGDGGGGSVFFFFSFGGSVFFFFSFGGVVFSEMQRPFLGIENGVRGQDGRRWRRAEARSTERKAATAGAEAEADGGEVNGAEGGGRMWRDGSGWRAAREWEGRGRDGRTERA